MTDEVETADKVAEAQPAGVSRDVILVVDDEDSIRRLLRLSLSRRLSGFEIVEAVDGLNALEQLRNGLADKVAVILVDNIMPRMSGMDVIAEIRGESTRVDQTLSLIHVDAMKYVPVFFMSGNAAADPNVNIDDLLRRRLITEFVQKPFMVKDVIASIRIALGLGGSDEGLSFTPMGTGEVVDNSQPVSKILQS